MAVVNTRAAMPTPGVPTGWKTPPDTTEQDKAREANLAALRKMEANPAWTVTS